MGTWTLLNLNNLYLFLPIYEERVSEQGCEPDQLSLPVLQGARPPHRLLPHRGRGRHHLWQGPGIG